MAQFKPGQSGNPEGKPKGTKSRKVEQWEKLSDYLLNSGAERFKKELIKLKGKDYVDAYNKTMEYFKPKLSRQQLEHSGEIDTPISVVELVEIKAADVKTAD